MNFKYIKLTTDITILQIYRCYINKFTLMLYTQIKLYSYRVNM